MIGGMKITESGFKAIGKLENLKILQLGHSEYQQEYKVNDVINMLSNKKFKNLKDLGLYGIVGSIGELLMFVVFACPRLNYLEIICLTDNRKDFHLNIIKLLFDSLPDLTGINLQWHYTSPTYNNIFVKSELEEIVHLQI